MELKEVRLSRGDRVQKQSDFKLYPTRYLVKIGQSFHAGWFNWFDLQSRWIFQGGPWPTYQYDPPETNNSNWNGVWEIIETDEERNRLSTHEILLSKGIGT